VLGASISGFATPFAVGYARHVLRSGRSRALGGAALAVACGEALICLLLAAGWLWNRIS
jgi:hypothetical protein